MAVKYLAHLFGKHNRNTTRTLITSILRFEKVDPQLQNMYFRSILCAVREA